MRKIGRNELCPCGSGRKFKKCHMGREEELDLEGLGEITAEEMGERITALPLVSYGHSKKMAESLELEALTGSSMGIKFVDLKSYADLNLFGSTPRKASKGKGGGVFINPYKTARADPNHLYVAISPDIDDSTLVHELAHVLDYLKEPDRVPGALEPLSQELGVPVDHLEHPEEFGYWLDFLHEKFEVQPDADDAIISYLYRKGMLIKGRDITGENPFVLKLKSDGIFKFLGENSEEIDDLIRNRPGYLGPRTVKD